MKYLFLLVSFISLAQQTQYVNFKTGLGKISLNTEQKSVGGNVIYNFEVLKAIDTIKIDAQNMTFKNVKLNGIAIQYLNTNKELQLIFPFKKGKNKLVKVNLKIVVYSGVNIFFCVRESAISLCCCL